MKLSSLWLLLIYQICNLSLIGAASAEQAATQEKYTCEMTGRFTDSFPNLEPVLCQLDNDCKRWVPRCAFYCEIIEKNLEGCKKNYTPNRYACLDLLKNRFGSKDQQFLLATVLFYIDFYGAVKTKDAKTLSFNSEDECFNAVRFMRCPRGADESLQAQAEFLCPKHSVTITNTCPTTTPSDSDMQNSEQPVKSVSAPN